MYQGTTSAPSKVAYPIEFHTSQRRGPSISITCMAAPNGTTSLVLTERFFSFYHLKSNVSVFLLRRQVTQSSINQYSPPVHEYCYGIPEQIMPMLTLWQHHILKIKQSKNNICVGNKAYCICKSF